MGYISQCVCNNLSAVLPTVFSMKWVCCNVGFQVSLFFLSQASAKELAESVDLLLQLQEPADSLCAEFLAHAETRLGEQLTVLEGLQDQVGSPISKISENLKMCFTASCYSSSIL